MRIAYVEMAGFRGFKDATRIDLPAGFVVLTGRNGAGKSTVLDAIDFALTGTINKYSVTNAKGGGLIDHIWWVGEGSADQHYVDVGFVDEVGTLIPIRRSRERGLEIDLATIAKSFCKEAPSDGWPTTLIRTSLIRDETISELSLDLPEQSRFIAVRDAMGGLAGPDNSVRTSAVLAAAKSARGEQEARTKEIQADLSRTLTALTEARSAAGRQPGAQEADRLIAQIDPNLVGEPPEVLARNTAERREKVIRQLEILDELESSLSELARHDSEDYRRQFEAALVFQRDSLNSQAVAKNEIERAEWMLDKAQSMDEFAGHLAQIAKHGEEIGLINGHCPLCDAARSEPDFLAALRKTRDRLTGIGNDVLLLTDERDRAQRDFRAATQAVERGETLLKEFELRRDALNDRLNALQNRLRELSDLMPEDADGSIDPVAARRALLREQERNSFLERALYIRQSSSAHDRVTSLEGRVAHLRQQIETETAKLSVLERVHDAARQIDTAAKSVANEVMTEQFDIVLPLLKELYRRLRPHADWREIETDFGGSVRATLNFTVGDGRNPQFLFSSGQRRAAGIAFLLAIHLSRPWCKLRTLLLDDPVQHIDDYRALNLVEVLSAIRQTGRQVLIAVEDIALAELLCRRLRSTGAEPGVRLELAMSKDGSASIERRTEVYPLPQEVLAEAS